MKKVFTIDETPLPSPVGDNQADIQKQIIELIKKRAGLMNDIEEADEKSRKWERNVLLEMLEVQDGLERIIKQAAELAKESGVETLAESILTASNQLAHVLNHRGVAAFNTVGKPADPQLTEIIGEEAGNFNPGYVIREIEKGYLYNNKLLRRAKVIICRQKES